ncbi:MAG: 50S ribosome-binding GTPase, partial [Magnetococcales bacterium]|nr:50S ribosome-binding GTPase [Magnetococcales bacterium]
PLPPAPPREALESRLEQAAALGAGIEEARRELAERDARHAGGEIHLVLAGEINAGKSTLIRALIPDGAAEISPVGGATREVARQSWRAPNGTRVILGDLPGLNEVGEVLSEAARDEILRSHGVIFLSEGDLTRDQFRELTLLAGLGKPLIVALSKSDQWRPEDLARVRRRLGERLATLPPSPGGVEIAAVSGGGVREVIRPLPGGGEERLRRVAPPDTRELLQAVTRLLGKDGALLEGLRDRAVHHLAANKLERAIASHRHLEADRLVGSYARKAVAGAMAAVTPGMDVVIQGYLGFQLIQELCQLYETPVTRLEAERLLKEATTRADRALPLLLATVGNALKAFPGAGTLAGGAVHAVCYGLLFESLGRALIRVLEREGQLAAEAAARLFEEELESPLEERLKGVALSALAAALEPRTIGRGTEGST